MTDLSFVALSALLSIARPPAADPIAERPRLEAMAAAIADAVEDADELAAWVPGAGSPRDTVLPLPITGPMARQATVRLLVAIAYNESHLRAAVADCRITGDRLPWHLPHQGRSVTAWQLFRGQAWGPYSRQDLCASPRLAAERALWVVSYHAARCGTPQKALHGYASGSCARPSRAARDHCRRWERLCAAAGIRASCDRRNVE